MANPKSWLKQDYGQYKAYLRSNQWKGKRQLALDRDKCCQYCSSTEHLQVHHKTYDNLFNEPLDDLVTLCRRCHLVVILPSNRSNIKNTHYHLQKI